MFINTRKKSKTKPMMVRIGCPGLDSGEVKKMYPFVTHAARIENIVTVHATLLLEIAALHRFFDALSRRRNR
jgi:hypothetical protein